MAPDLYKLAAAFVVTTLAEHEEGYEGFCGASDWRSIGLQYLATTDHIFNEEHQKLLLARAVELDPENLLASASLYARSVPEEDASGGVEGIP